MKRFAAWTAWIAVAALSHGAQSHPATVNYGYLGVSQVRAVRVSDACFISPATPAAWGWQVTHESGSTYQVKIGERTLSVEGTKIEGTEMLSLSDIARELDADGTWRPKTDIFDVRSRIRVIRLLNGHLTVSASLPIESNASYDEKTGKAAVDVQGACLSPDALADVLPGLTISAPKPGTIRIQIPTSGPLAVDRHFGEPTTDIDLDTSLVIASTREPVEETLKLESETDGSIELSLPLPVKLSRQPEFSRLEADKLSISLPGVNVLLASDGIASKSIRHVSANPTAGGTELVFDLVRPMGVTLSTDGGLRIRFVKPPVGDGQLAGKTIVVDAGHGGKDSGAKGADGLFEKQLTLPIAKQLAAELAAQGATVIMTRETDVFISLEERAAIANRNKANLFLCIHINSNGGDHTTSGTITFYHNNDPVSSTLADCIQREIVKVSGIPGIGTWSDTKIYHSGFSVLRNTKMPSVLIETGFINNTHDRKQMVRPEIQAAIAAAIVRGVQVYLGQPSTHEK